MFEVCAVPSQESVAFVGKDFTYKIDVPSSQSLQKYFVLGLDDSFGIVLNSATGTLSGVPTLAAAIVSPITLYVVGLSASGDQYKSNLILQITNFSELPRNNLKQSKSPTSSRQMPARSSAVDQNGFLIGNTPNSIVSSTPANEILSVTPFEGIRTFQTNVVRGAKFSLDLSS